MGFILTAESAAFLDAGSLRAALRGFAVTLVVFIALMAWSLLPFPAGFGTASLGYVSALWIAVVLPVALLVCLGLSVRAARRATRWASERVRLFILAARASFYLGIGLVLEVAPVQIAGVISSHYGPSVYDVDRSTWIGLALVAPFLACVIVGSLRVLHTVSDARARDRGRLALAGSSAVVVAVPLLALAVDASWSLPYGSYSWTPPGYYIETVGAGLEAVFAFLLATALPAYGLALPGYRPHVRGALGLGLATVALGAVSLLLVLGPTVSYLGPWWWYSRVFGFQGLLIGSWGPVPSALAMAGAVLLLVAYVGTDRSLASAAPAAPPETEALTGGP